MSFFRFFSANIRNSGFAVHYVARSLIVLASLSGLSTTANAADDTFACLNELSGPLTVFQGTSGYVENDYFNLPDGARFDARGATFYGQTDPVLSDGSIIDYPVDLRSDFANSYCWAGGVVHFTNDYDITWTQSKHPNNAAFNTRAGTVIWDGVRVHNAHDAFRPDRNVNGWWEIRNSWVSYNRDDCIENDYFASGLVDDSLFDGCYVFLSSRNGLTDVPLNTVTVQSSLVRMQKMPGPYGHPDPSVMGFGMIFKYQGDSPELVLRNNIFLIEGCGSTRYNADACGHTEYIGFFPDTKLGECTGNVIVWLGEGEFPGDIPDDPACVTVTKDRTVWDAARAKWLAEHPLVARIYGVDAPAPQQDTALDPAPEPEPIPELEPDPEPTPEPDPDITLEPAPEPDSTVEPAPDTTDKTRWFRKDRTGSTFRDGQSPSVDIISPIGGTKVFPSTSLWVEVDVSDNVGVARLEVYINKGPPYIFEGDGTHGFAWVVDNSRNWHVINALAYDESGNKSVDRIRVFTVR